MAYTTKCLLISEKDTLPTIPTKQGQTVYIGLPIYFVHIFHETHQGMVILLNFITIFMHFGHKSIFFYKNIYYFLIANLPLANIKENVLI